MYNQTFPDTVPEDVYGSSSIGRLTQQYNPWQALSAASAGRSGGQPTGAESDILNRSLFGQTAQLDLGNVRDAQAAKNNLVTAFASGGQYNKMADEIYNSMGGKMQAPTAPNFGSLKMPTAPNMNQLRMPTAPNISQLGTLPDARDLSNTMFNTYNKFANSQPGFQAAQQSSLRGGDILKNALAAMQQQGGAMDQYVNPLVSATEAASKRALANSNTELMSRFAGEGAFMSGPMMSALSNQAGDSSVNLAKEIGGIRLQAANDQANRIYGGATSQAQIQAQQAQALSDQYAKMAMETGNQQAALAASAYKAKADMLSSSYATQGGMYNNQLNSLDNSFNNQTSMYNNQLNSLDNTFNTQMTGYTAQNQTAQAQVTQRAKDLMDQYGMGVDQAMNIAQAQQGNEQAALTNLRANYMDPGEQQLAILSALMGFPTVSKTVGGGGFDIGKVLQGAGSGAAQGGAMGGPWGAVAGGVIGGGSAALSK